MKLSSYAICSTGLVRKDNQDNLYINGVYREDINNNTDFRYANTIDNCGLYVVADGMGGEKHGELASLIAVQGLRSVNPADGYQGVMASINESNSRICGLMMENKVRIGSTFVGLCINENRADVINIGDSRLYFLRGGELKQLSRDHTSIRQMLDLGAISEEAAKKHPDRHKLTQHLGIFPDEMIIEPYTISVDIEAGDIFLLCSDGLTDMLSDSEIKDILGAVGPIEKKAETLVEGAMRNGGKDNTSVLLVQVMQNVTAKKGGAKNAVINAHQPTTKHHEKKKSKLPLILAIIALLLFAAAIAIFVLKELGNT